jgi:phosphoenolpyruvate-protein kinase (PTS system EI component)
MGIDELSVSCGAVLKIRKQIADIALETDPYSFNEDF